MWLPRNAVAKLLTAFTIIAGAGALTGCSFTPLYSTQSGVADQIELAYADPASRLEQIIYQDLALRLGRSNALNAPVVQISASAGSRRVGRTSSGSPATTYEATVTATVTVTQKTGDTTETLYQATRRASASYTTNGQRLADRQALEEANERAALAVAQSLRLLLTANLPDKL